MSLPVFPHTSFDSLMEGLAGEWAVRGDGPLPVPVVVPSVQFSDYLQLRIARDCGVCMGFDFLMPQGFISRALGDRDDSWSKQRLCWRILPHVSTYAGELGVEETSARDRFAIAGLLSDRFDQYAHFRPELIRKWLAAGSGKSSAFPESPAEKWQRELWLKLSDEIASPHPALSVERLKTDAEFRSRIVAAFPRLLVIGTGSVDPLLIDVIGLLHESGGDVSAHVVLPSLEYLGDLKRRNVLPQEETHPESIEVAGGHPLLESMGRHAIGSFLLLGKLDEQYTHWPEPGDGEAAGGSLLQQIQADIHALSRSSKIKKSADDISLRVHSCFGPRREIEALRNELFRAFQDFPDLKPEDIHIITPSLEIYAPLVTAILEQGGVRLPVRLTELPPSGQDPVIEGALVLLDVARGGSFEASWLMELLRLRAVQGALGISDEKSIERVRGWIRQSGLTQGLGVGEPGEWGFARDRLIAGRWFGAGDMAVYPDNRFILPVADQLDGDQDLMSRFIAWHSCLEETFREWGRDVKASEWGRRIGLACDELLAGKDEGRLAIQPHLAFLLSLECSELLDAGAILDWLAAECGEAGVRGKVSGRIACGRFKQLQNIPCRVLAMIGMQEGTFPGQSPVPAWDLLQTSPRVWDRNARVDDRQLFLDAVLTPRDRLIITAANRNVRSGKDEPLSPCVDEILRVAGEMGVAKSELIVKHRLQPFATEYFDGSLQLPPSFDPVHAEAAAALASGERHPGIPFLLASEGTASEPDRQEISVRQLVDFWKKPAKAFLKAQGVAILKGEEDEEALDRAPLTLNDLQTWGIKSAVIDTIIGSTSTMDYTEALFRANRGLPPGNLGTQSWKANHDLSEPLGNGVKNHLSGKLAVEVKVGDVRVTGTLMTADDGKHLLAYRVGEFKNAGHFLDPWICAVVAAAHGHTMPLWLLDEASPDQPKEFPAMEKEEAEEVLTNLVRGFLEGQESALKYGAATSDAFAKKMAETGDEALALEAAAAAWSKQGFNGGQDGEMFDSSALLVWRDLDAFAVPGPWAGWAKAVAVPLRKWGGF